MDVTRECKLTWFVSKGDEGVIVQVWHKGTPVACIGYDGWGATTVGYGMVEGKRGYFRVEYDELEVKRLLG